MNISICYWFSFSQYQLLKQHLAQYHLYKQANIMHLVSGHLNQRLHKQLKVLSYSTPVLHVNSGMGGKTSVRHLGTSSQQKFRLSHFASKVCPLIQSFLTVHFNATARIIHLPKNRESTVWLRVEGRPEGPPASRLLSLRGFGSSGSWRGR